MKRPNRVIAYRLSAIAMLAFLTSNCASGPAIEPGIDLKTLPGRFAERPVSKPLKAVEAVIADDQFYLSYEGEDGLVYSGGDWSDET